MLFEIALGAAFTGGLAGGVVAAFGIYGLIKTLQPAAIAGDGLLCYLVPGLGGLLR